MSRVWLALCLLVVLVSCSAPARQDTIPPTATLSSPPATPTSSELEIGASAYSCVGHEAGMLASAGGLTFHPDGTFIFGMAPASPSGTIERGRYSYDDATKTYAFLDHPIFDHAVYDEGLRYLLVTFKPGKTLSHAESGRLECQ